MISSSGEKSKAGGGHCSAVVPCLVLSELAVLDGSSLPGPDWIFCSRLWVVIGLDWHTHIPTG